MNKKVISYFKNFFKFKSTSDEKIINCFQIKVKNKAIKYSFLIGFFVIPTVFSLILWILFQLKILPDLKSKKHWGSILNIDVFIFSLLITTTFLVFLIFLDKKKYFHPDLKIIFLFTGVYFINLIISSFHKPENNPQYRAMKEVIFILCYIIIILLCIYVFLQVIHLWEMIVQNFKYYKNEMLKVFIIVFSVFLIFLIFTPFGGEKDISNNQSKLLEIFKNYPFSASVQTIIVAPIIEEILYRYLIFRFINNPFHATIFSAFFFASAHVFSSFDWYHLGTYLPMSAILGFIYWKSNGNLTYIIICHFVNNLFATFLLFWFNN